MLFCPTCANLLVISNDSTGYNKWACNTCAYEFPITKQMTSRERMKRKAVEDVFDAEASFKDADSTSVACPSCDNDRAYYYQLQIRSADEPMTTCVQNVLTAGATAKASTLTRQNRKILPSIRIASAVGDK